MSPGRSRGGPGYTETEVPGTVGSGSTVEVPLGLCGFPDNGCPTILTRVQEEPSKGDPETSGPETLLSSLLNSVTEVWVVRVDVSSLLVYVDRWYPDGLDCGFLVGWVADRVSSRVVCE